MDFHFYTCCREVPLSHGNTKDTPLRESEKLKSASLTPP
eukprot:UN04499